MNKSTFAALCALAVSTATHAATISWSSQIATTSGPGNSILESGLFATTGSLLLAENSGGEATTFDGINFAAGTITLGNTHPAYHGDTGLTSLIGTGTYSNSSATVSLTGLTPGASYRIQALLYDGRGPQSGRTVEFDGANMGQYANGVDGVSWGNEGRLVTGTFTADGSGTQDFNIEVFESGGTTSAGSQLNALVLHQVPEPSGLLLGGLGMLLGVMRRRR